MHAINNIKRMGMSQFSKIHAKNAINKKNIWGHKKIILYLIILYLQTKIVCKALVMNGLSWKLDS